MVSYNKIIGLPLLILNEGKKSGIVHEIVFEINRNIVAGFIIIEIGKKRKFVEMSDIKLLEDKIIIQDYMSMKNWDKSRSKDKRFVCGKELIMKKVFDYIGNEVGYICDIFMDFQIGSVEAFHLTDGIVEDLIEGRKIIPVLGKTVLKEEGLFVGKESVEEFVDVKKGIKQIFSIHEEVITKNLQRSD